MKPISRIVLWIIILGSPLLALVTLLGPQASQQPQVLIQAAKRATLEKRIAATGQLEPKNYVDVGAQVSGQISKLYVEEGDEVKAGQLLAEIDASVFEIQVQTAEASLLNQKATLRQQQAELKLEQLRLKRNEQLFQRGSLSEDELEESRTTVAILKAQIDGILAQIQANTAELEGDKVTLSYATIRAPIDGVITDLQVREGQTLNANQSAPELMTIINLDRMSLRAEVSEADVSKLFVGMPVSFSTLGEPENYWHSEVRQILASPEEVNDVVLYQILIDIDNPEHKLMDSMTTKVFFIEERSEQGLVVPLGALKEGPEGYQIMVLQNDQLEPRLVQVGLKNRTQAEILSGLREGELVMTGTRQEKSDQSSQKESIMGLGMGAPMPPPGGGGGPRHGG